VFNTGGRKIRKREEPVYLADAGSGKTKSRLGVGGFQRVWLKPPWQKRDKAKDIKPAIKAQREK